MPAPISFGGLSSGLDTQSIVAQLVALRRRPILRLEDQKDDLNLRLKLFGDLESRLKDLGKAARALDTRDEIVSKTVASSHEDIFTATATARATLGTHSLQVSQLATPQRDIYLGMASIDDSVGEGTFTITVNGEQTDLTLQAGSTSLGDLQIAINDANLGVSATILNDGGATPYRLVLSSDESGEDNTFSLDLSGLSGGNAPALETSTAGVNALFNIDGVDIVSASNEAANVLQGVTLNLLDVKTDAPMELRVEPNNDAMKAKIDSFVSAYNEVVTFMNDQSLENATLNGSSLIRSVQSRLTSILIGGVDTGGNFRMLAEVGVKLQNDGTLEVDAEKQSGALETDFEGFVKVFIEENGVLGVAKQFDDLIDGLTDFSSGLFKSSEKNINYQIDAIDDRIEREERSIDYYEETLNRKFSAMEQLISGLQAQAGFLQSRFNY